MGRPVRSAKERNLEFEDGYFPRSADFREARALVPRATTETRDSVC